MDTKKTIKYAEYDIDNPINPDLFCITIGNTHTFTHLTSFLNLDIGLLMGQDSSKEPIIFNLSNCKEVGLKW